MAENWYVIQSGKRHGPYTGAELKRLAATGNFCPSTSSSRTGWPSRSRRRK
ncbi:MAG: DUF4339 domain-containing protein [Bacteroidales bacterium]|nr:DUF4339 domain-containing protein [Bacteroidales bacterium]